MPATRDWAATVFVLWRGRLLLHRHRKLDMWLPPGGHVERDELPDDAAVREDHHTLVTVSSGDPFHGLPHSQSETLR